MMRHLIIDFSESYRWNLGKDLLFCLDCLGKDGRKRQSPTTTLSFEVEETEILQKNLGGQIQRIPKCIWVGEHTSSDFF